MKQLKPKTILRRANNIEIHLNSVTEIEICINGSNTSFPNICLSILDIFTYPISLKDGLKKLKSKVLFDWIEITGNINNLYKSGALTTSEKKDFDGEKNFWGFGASPVHIAMLSDTNRTQKLIKAINETVKEGDIVVDIGTGTGILAITAARAGAAKVYAIESSGIADIAQEIIDKTEVVDKIEIIRGWSTQIDLPQKADVLVSEIIGNDPFAEKVLQSFIDARQRLLKPDAKLIPNRIKVLGVKVLLTSDLLKFRIINSEKLENWRNLYNIDFTALNPNSNQPLQSFEITTQKAAELELENEPELLVEVDFYSFQETKIENTLTLNRRNHFNGLLIYFELELGSEIITTHPKFADKNNHWLNQIWILPEKQKLEINDTLKIGYKYSGSNSEVILINDMAISEK